MNNEQRKLSVGSIIGVILAVLTVIAATPSMQDFLATHFSTTGNVVAIKSPNPTLASAITAGATTFSVSAVPSNAVPGSGFMIIEPGTNCEVRRIASISGTTITPVVARSTSFTRLQFTNNTIQLRRAITSASGNGTIATIHTFGAHLLANNSPVRIDGTTNFNVVSTNVTVVDADTFTFPWDVTTNDFAGGFSIHTSDIDDLAAYFDTQTIVVSGSAGNNRVYTITNVVGAYDTNLVSALDGGALMVAEATTSEVSGNATTLTINLNRSHPAGAPVWFMPGEAINVQWYGALSSGSTADAGRNRLAFQRAIDDGWTMGLRALYVPGGSGRYYVNGTIYLERESVVRGDGPKASLISAFGMSFPDINHAVVRGRRDGRVQAVSHGGYSARHTMQDIAIEGGMISGANGFVGSVQQPMKWDFVDIRDCPGWGMILCDTQQGTFEDLAFVRCGTTENRNSGALWLRGGQFLTFANTFNIEQIATGAYNVKITEGQSASRNIIFQNSHFEASGTLPAAFYYATGNVYNLMFDGGYFGIGSTITNFYFDFGAQTEGAVTYTIRNIESGGADSPSDCIAIYDVERKLNIPWNDTHSPFHHMIQLFVAGNHNPATSASNTNGQHAIWIPGLNGRLVKIGASHGGSANAPSYFSQLSSSTEVHFKFFNAVSNLTLGIYSGGVSNFGTHYVQGLAQFDTNTTVLGTNIVNWQQMPQMTASRALVLDASKRVTVASGTPDGTKFLRDDGAYAVPAGNLPSADPTPGAMLGSDGAGILNYRTYRNSIRMVEEFVGDAGSGIGGHSLGWNSTANSGVLANALMVAGTSNYWGIVTVSTSTSASSAPVLHLFRSSMGFGGGTLFGRFVFRLEDLSDGTESYQARVGWGDTSSSAMSVDCAQLFYSHDANSGNFQFITGAASGYSTNNSPALPAAAADTWYVLDIYGNAAANQVIAYLNYTPVATNTAAIPDLKNSIQRAFSPEFQMVKTVGTTARFMYVDYFGMEFSPTVSR